MNLLPQSHSDFQSEEYWDRFFKKRGKKEFEWYGEYPELCGVLHKYIRPKDKLLVVGCGNSVISENLYDVGYHNIVNIDISDVVIRQMLDKNQTKRPDMKFLKKDVTKMDFEDGEFTAVFDKGTLDALMFDDSEAVVNDIEAMFSEIGRVLKQGGRYIIVSLLQDHILKKILSYFPEIGWPIRFHRINTDNSENKDFHMPVFAVVLTKFKKLPNMKQILEVSTTDDKVERYDNVELIKTVLKEMQYYALIRQQITKRNVSKEQVSLCLYSDVSSSPRYILYIVDNTKNHKKFAVFIVPQGRETDWLFSTEAGRQQLSDSAGFERLVVACLHREHSYSDLDSIKSDLSTKVMELAPPGFKSSVQVPFLSLGQDIGKRQIVYKGRSEFSGEYIIEDVDVDGNMYRRLVFSVNPNIVQSEAKLKSASSKKKGRKNEKLTVDHSYLACQHHISMVAGLGFIPKISQFKDGELSVLLIGLGGGGLATFLHQHFKQMNLTVVDIDEAMATIATEWFGFIRDEMLTVHVGDGLELVKQEVDKGLKRHVIMLDVDSKDTSVGISCPPQSFVKESFLLTMKTLLCSEGVLIVNLVCRDEVIKEDVIKCIRKNFDQVYIKDIEQEVNQIVYAINRIKPIETESRQESCDNSVNEIVTSDNSKYLASCVKNSSIDLSDQFKNMIIVDR